jgi:PAS domain S-box-containing protein
MDMDRNLLFGVLALQTDLIDASQFVEACTVWTTRKNVSLADLLVEKGWISVTDKADVERFLERKLKKHGGDARAGLATVTDDVKRSLAALENVEIQRSLAGLAAAPPEEATVDGVPAAGERYRLTRLHATGGLGRVWLARDSNLGRDVALKELRPERAENPAHGRRFLREAQITGQLEHPGIVPLYELARWPDSQQPFYTMRFVNGRTMHDAAGAYHQKRLAGQDEPLELLTLLNAFVGVCNTVAFAHARGVIHRDLKGQNVVLGDFGEVIVLDWGLAKLVDRPETAAVETVSVLLDGEERCGEVNLTATGQALGTPAYMSPEQAAGQLALIDRRTDVYGLGAILYEILTGKPPFTGSATHEILQKVREGEPVPPRRLWAGVPPSLERACLRALAKERADRYASAGELAQEVLQWQELQRKQAEEALVQERYLLHTLMDHLPDSIWFKDTSSRFLRVNKSLARFFGLADPAEAVGKTDFDFFTEEHARPRFADEQEVMRTGQPVVGKEEWETWPDGRDRWVSTTKMPFYDKDGKVIGTFGVSRDITGLKQAEEGMSNQQRER